jgi:TetR/AcrR family transcriptional regulator
MVTYMGRDPGRTRRRILAAALREFSLRGFAGARIDSIARRARVNKRMLYHYFGDKRDLYREIFRRKLAEKTEVTQTTPFDPAEGMPYWFQEIRGDLDWVRLLGWDSLGGGPGSSIAHEEYRELYAEALRWLRGAQQRRFVSEELSPEQLMLAFFALNMFPLAFPQITRAITGFSPTDRAFEEQHQELVRRLAQRLRPLPQERGSRDANPQGSLEPSGSGEAR